MAEMDFHDLLLDPELADTFNVVRRAETVDNFGEASVTETPYSNVIGVLRPTRPDDLQILPEGQRMGRHVTIVTNFRLQGPAPGYQPDEVQWGGDTFLVKEVLPYTRFGRGFIKAIAGSVDVIDQPNT